MRKICTYSILEISIGAIVDFFVVEKGMYKGDLETAACKEVLENLINSGLKIRHFVTDENTKIAQMMRTCFSTIIHNYDIWHKARLIKRKLQEMTKKLPKLSDSVVPIEAPLQPAPCIYSSAYCTLSYKPRMDNFMLRESIVLPTVSAVHWFGGGFS